MIATLFVFVYVPLIDVSLVHVFLIDVLLVHVLLVDGSLIHGPFIHRRLAHCLFTLNVVGMHTLTLVFESFGILGYGGEEEGEWDDKTKI